MCCLTERFKMMGQAVWKTTKKSGFVVFFSTPIFEPLFRVILIAMPEKGRYIIMYMSNINTHPHNFSIYMFSMITWNHMERFSPNIDPIGLQPWVVQKAHDDCCHGGSQYWHPSPRDDDGVVLRLEILRFADFHHIWSQYVTMVSICIIPQKHPTTSNMCKKLIDEAWWNMNPSQVFI